MFNLEKGEQTGPRLGRLETPHGIIETPAYVIVGTHGYVKSLEPGDVEKTGTQLIISNTYHLWRDLGEEGLGDFPGLAAYLGWDGPTMTDSGGFQVFSFGARKSSGDVYARREDSKNEVQVTDSGVKFFDEEGLERWLDSEISIRIQEQIGADIIVAFDEPCAPNATHEAAEIAMRRTHAWAKRSIEAKESKQILYGVVQGGSYEDLRKESARTIGSMDFDGFAVGGTYGDAYGGTKADTRKVLDWVLKELPKDKPRHLFGVGRIDDILSGVSAGIDTFDCVIPTREARHGRLWTEGGALDITKAEHAGSSEPLSKNCDCEACRAVNRDQLQEMFRAKDLSAGRWATIHNVYFFNSLMSQIRGAIRDNRWAEFEQETLRKFKIAR